MKNVKPSVAAMFKVNLKDVIFASSASAAALVAEAKAESDRKYNFMQNGFARPIEINGSEYFGKRTQNELPDYGMYLKTAYTEDPQFQVNSLELSDNNLTVDFSNEKQGGYIVIHAFKEDNLVEGSKSYVATAFIPKDSIQKTINVSGWGNQFDLNGYTIKIWLEDGNSASLAKATGEPKTFYGTSSGISNEGTEFKNLRVFADVKELKCSWGKLDNISQAEAETVTGRQATNQKIYFGTGPDGKPLQFWIAGRETENGRPDSSGNIMCLYQAKGIDQAVFNQD